MGANKDSSKTDPDSTAADEAAANAANDAKQLAAAIKTGTVRVIAESKTHRILEDDTRRWKEAK